MAKQCPKCNSSEWVRREYLYGMPSESPDLDQYIIGGCCISKDMPEIKCSKCGWQGFTVEKGKKSPILYVEHLK
jgi:hypothetical protein